MYNQNFGTFQKKQYYYKKSEPEKRIYKKMYKYLINNIEKLDILT